MKAWLSSVVENQLLDVLFRHTKEIENVQHTLTIETSRCLKLDLGLGAPGNSKTSRMKHKKVVRTVADRNNLGDWNAVLRRERLEKLTLLACINNRVSGYKLAGESLRRLVDFELKMDISP